MDEENPGADTAMFQRFVTDGDAAAPQTVAPNRTLWIAASVAIAVALIVVALLVVL